MRRFRNSGWRAAAVVSGAGLIAALSGCAVGPEESAGASNPAAAVVLPAQQDGDDETVSRPGTITVRGVGEVTAVPDTAHVQLGVRVSGESAQATLDLANERAGGVLAALDAQGVAPEDVRTSGLSLWPVYAANGRTVTGYEAANSVDVTIRDLPRAGAIIDAAAGLAGDAATISGIWFSISDPESVLPDARAAAVENARKRANEYADAAGAEVGEVVLISEIGVEVPLPAFERAAEDAAGGGVPVSPGSQDVMVDVTVVFELVTD